MSLNKQAWQKNLKVGDEVICRVVEHKIFGVFVQIDNEIVGIIERIQMEQDGYSTPGDYPPIGSCIKAKVISFRERNRQVDVKLIS